MSFPSFAVYTIVGVVGSTLVLIICGAFESRIRVVAEAFFSLLLNPFILIGDSLEKFWGGVAKFYRGQFTVEGKLDLQDVFLEFIGAKIHCSFFLVFIFSEFHLLALSLVAAGIDVGHYNPPMGAGTLTALAIISSILLWGAIICDLIGITRTIPWRETISSQYKRCLLYMVVFSLLLSLFVTVTMGLFRGKVIADESLDPSSSSYSENGSLNGFNSGLRADFFGVSDEIADAPKEGLYYWIPIIANISIPILVLFGGVFSSWSLVAVIKFLMLIAAFLIISPLGLLLLSSRIWAEVVQRFYQFSSVAIQLFGAMGRRILTLLGWEQLDVHDADDPESPDEDHHTEHAENPQENQEEKQSESIIEPSSEGWNPFAK